MIRKIIFLILYKIPNSFFPILLGFYLSFFKIKKNKKNGRILYINTHDKSGGASKIAFLLASSQLKKRGVNFLVKFKMTSENWVHILQNNNESFNLFFSNYLNDQEKKGEWLDFSQISLLRYINNDFFKNSSMIHLHNLHGGYFSYALLPFISKYKHVIWTLHDEHIITGHCSFTMNCLGWKNNCTNCQFLNIYPSLTNDNSSLILKYKRKWLQNSKITYVSPSLWLHDRVITAFPFLKNNIKIIPNGIDSEVFSPFLKLESRKSFDLPINKFLVLFIAEFSTNNPFKGGETFREIVGAIDDSSILFITVGGLHNETKISSKMIELPYISDEKKLSFLYSACDLMVYPTNADNHPLVVLEAMSCGLPVLAPEIGGIPEIIENNLDGWLVPRYSNAKTYLNRIKLITEFKNENQSLFSEISKNARNKILNKFNINKMILEYENLYKKVMNE